MPSEIEDDPLAPTATLPPTRPAEAGPTPARLSAGGDARDEAPGQRPGGGRAAGDGVDRVLELVDQFLAEAERTLAALVAEVAPAA